MNLSKLLVDSLQKRTISRLARSLGCYDSQLGSIKLLGECLLALGIDQQVVDDLIGFLGELWATRSRIAHPGTIELDDYVSHFRGLIARGAEVVEILADIVDRISSEDLLVA